MTYEELLGEAEQHEVDTYERLMRPTIKGLYGDNIIWINQGIVTNVEKACVLAEELGHYHTSFGDILDQEDLSNRKQEKRARNWAYEKLVPLEKIVHAYMAGVRNRFELSEYLGIMEDFLKEAIKHYQEKYGMYTTLNGRYIIYFDSLGVVERFE